MIFLNTGSTRGNIFIYTAVSVKSLILAGNKVINHLKADGVEKARTALQEIVSRDTSKMDKNQIIRGTKKQPPKTSATALSLPCFCSFGRRAVSYGV